MAVHGGFGDTGDSDALDHYLDAPEEGRPAGLDPALAGVVDALRRLPRGDWERLAPDSPVRRPWRRDVIVAAAAVVAVLGLLLGLTAGGGHGPTTASGGGTWRMASLLEQSSWHVGSTSLPSENLTCPTTQQCYASDASSSVLEVSGDGGQTFSAVPLPDGSTITTGLSCATPLDCWAGGLAPPTGLSGVPAIPEAVLGGGTATTEATGGSPPSDPGPGTQADPVGGTEIPILLGTVDGGSAFTVLALPTGVSQVADVVCRSADNCLAVVDLSSGTSSAVVVTDDGGTTWSSSGPLSESFVPVVHQGLACAHKTCVLVGADLSTPPVPTTFSSNDGGATWAAGGNLDGLAVVDAVQCPSKHRCVAVGQAPAPDDATTSVGPGVVLTSGDAGASWTAANAVGLPDANLYTLACSGRSRCWVGGALSGGPVDTGYALLATTGDGGATFALPGLPAADGSGNALDFDAVLSLSCPQHTCVALAALSSSAGTGAAQAVLTGS